MNMMNYLSKPPPITPRIIIHGGAGNITRDNMPSDSYKAYRSALLSIVRKANSALFKPHASALDIATYAVSLLELNPLFNAGHGAVYTTAGTHELEASVMVSNGYRKRGVGVMKVRKAKSPIELAREMLVRGEEEDGGGAQGHCQLEGETIDKLAEEWGLEIVNPSYFWTRRRWEEHRRGLGLEYDDETYERAKREADEGSNVDVESKEDLDMDCKEELQDDVDISAAGDIHWDGKEYLPQGTVGAVVLDSTGTLCVATSTGGLTNKLPGRIGDTPTLGAGFWSEQWDDPSTSTSHEQSSSMFNLPAMVNDCLPFLAGYTPIPTQPTEQSRRSNVRAVAMSGTGNGDSFLRVNAVRTAAAIARYASDPAQANKYSHTRDGRVSLQQALTAIAGPHGQLQNSAGDRWLRTGEGEGGIIGIELVDGKGRIAYDFNCGGMFHAWIDDEGDAQFELFQDGPRPPP